LNHLDRTKKEGPEPNDPNQQGPVTVAEQKARRHPPQCDVQLMTENDVLGFKSTARLEQVGNEHSERMQDRKHR
jgi:hypothetical protein